MRPTAFLENLHQDIRYALRMMRKNPAFAATAVLTLALGIGANTAIFSVVHAVLLKPLDYPEPGRLVRITGGATAARFEMLRQANSFTGVAAFAVYTENVTLSRPQGPEPLKGALVSTNFLDVLGVTPLQGRGFLPGEEQLGPKVAWISAELWRRQFAADPGIVGGDVTLDGAPYTISGVVPSGLQLPFPDIDVWRPWQPGAMPSQARLNSPILSVFGRLKPGVELAQANAEVSVINRQYAGRSPGRSRRQADATARRRLGTIGRRPARESVEG